MVDASDREIERHYAGFWIRALASCLDDVVLTLPSLLLAWPWLGLFEAKMAGFWIQVIGTIIYVLLGFGYYGWGQYRYQTTLGKRLFGIRVVNFADLGRISLKQSMIRYLAYGLSGIIAGAGFLMAAFQPEKRALHDLVAGTVSVRGKST